MASTTKFTAAIAMAAILTTSALAQFRDVHHISVQSADELSAAIQQASSPGRVTYIDIAPGFYNLAATSQHRKELYIGAGTVVIRGQQLSPAVLDIAGADRFFEVAKNAKLMLSDVVLQNGISPIPRHPAKPFKSHGGAIYNAGSVTLLRCALVQNMTSFSFEFVPQLWRSGSGGAIYNTGTLAMTDCALSNNLCSVYGADSYAGGSGGAIYNSGVARLKNCIIRHNFADGGSPGSVPAGNGGGICNTGSMLLDTCLVTNNASGFGAHAAYIYGTTTLVPAGNGGMGGGIYNSGRLIVDKTIIAGNRAGNGGGGLSSDGADGGGGGGICNDGQLTLTRSFIYNNNSGSGGSPSTGLQQGGSGGDGAGIFNGGVLNLRLCTIAGNTCGAGGKTAYSFSGNVIISGPGSGPGDYPPPPPPFTNSPPVDTLPLPSPGNGGNGGGIYNSGTLTAVASTICNNAAGNGADGWTIGLSIGPSRPGGPFIGGPGGNGGNAGGIYNAGLTAQTKIGNTILALNSAGLGGSGGLDTPAGGLPTTNGPAGTNGAGPDLAGAVNSLGYNLVETTDSFGSLAVDSTDIVGTTDAPMDPMLSPITTPDDTTPPYTLLPGSPAIDKGLAFGLQTDMCDHKRVNDDSTIPNAPGGDGTDIGAVELQ